MQQRINGHRLALTANTKHATRKTPRRSLQRMLLRPACSAEVQQTQHHAQHRACNIRRAA
eukprot:9443217-Alexandrium_andersonii.AAC.1